MKTKMSISRRDRSFDVELLKKCSTSTGYDIYCFRNLGCTGGITPYIVGVKNCHGDTVEFLHCISVKQAFQYYLEFICCYA